MKKKNEINKTIDNIYNDNILLSFSETIKYSTESSLIYIANSLISKLYQSNKPIIENIKTIQEKTYDDIFNYIILLISTKILNTNDYKNLIVNTNCFEKIKTYLNKRNNNKPTYSFIEIQIRDIPLSKYISSYAKKKPQILIILRCFSYIKNYISLLGVPKEEIKPKIILTFLNLYLQNPEDYVFSTYVIISKLMNFKTNGSNDSYLKNALSSIEPDYEEYFAYLDELFRLNIFPELPDTDEVEKYFDCYINYASL